MPRSSLKANVFPMVLPKDLRRGLADGQVSHREQLALGDRSERPVIIPIFDIGELRDDPFEHLLGCAIQRLRVRLLHELLG